MKNTFMENLIDTNNFGLSENGSIKHLTTKSAVLDMFALCGAYRRRSEEDCILAFKNAYEENPVLALKCLFYLRDCRGGQGERRFFRVCFRWLANNYPVAAERNLINISEYGRWDDLIYATVETPMERKALAVIAKQLALDTECKTPSLLAKWLPSENASSKETKRVANIVRVGLGMTHKTYRQILSELRTKINIVEKLMSQNRWDEIEFDKIPSKAGLVYKNAFARRDLIAKKYAEFAKDETKTVNASTLYPYDVAHKVFTDTYRHDVGHTDRLMVQKYWDALPNYYGENEENGLAIVDTSGSMSGQPLEAAVSLGAYIAEKAHGPFAGHFITFSQRPELIKFEGVDITDKFMRARRASWQMNTDLKAVFDMLLRVAKQNDTKVQDMPQRLYIFSDMEFDGCLSLRYCGEGKVNTLLENIAVEWAAAGYELPKVVFWNLECRQENIPALGNRFSYVSGLSPVMIETILSGKDGYSLCLEKLMSERYAVIQ